MKEYMDLLGKKARDRVTNFEGIVTSVCFDLYGCVQVVVSPQLKDGKVEDGRWMDAKRLEITDNTPVMPQPAFENLRAGQEIGPAEKPAPSSHTR